MKPFASLALALGIVTVVAGPASAAQSWDEYPRTHQLRAEIRAQIRESLREARRAVRDARREAFRARFRADRDRWEYR